VAHKTPSRAWQHVFCLAGLAVLAVAGCKHGEGAAKGIWVAGARTAIERSVAAARREEALPAVMMSFPARRMARFDRKGALGLIDEAVRRARRIPVLGPVSPERSTEGRIVRGEGRLDAFRTLGGVAVKLQPERGVQLLSEAFDLAENTPAAEGYDRGHTMALIAADIARAEPSAGLRLASRVPGVYNQAYVLATAAIVLAATDPNRAESTLQRVTRLLTDAGKPYSADSARARVTAALGRNYPQRAAVLLSSVKDAANRDEALAGLVRSDAHRDPVRALTYARKIREAGGVTTAFLLLAWAQPHDAGRYLGPAAAAIRRGMPQSDWRTPLPMLVQVSWVALSLAAASDKSEALSLINLAARQARERCRDKASRSIALIFLSGTASQLNRRLGRQMLEEALADVAPVIAYHPEVNLPRVAGALSILDADLAETYVQHLPRDSQREALFWMARDSAGTHPDLARKWLARGENLEWSRKEGLQEAEAHALAQAALLADPSFALKTAARAAASVVSR